MRAAWTPPAGEWPVIRGGVVRRVPDVAATPALTASARWRYALRDDTYIDHRLRLLTGARVRARLHVSPSAVLPPRATANSSPPIACEAAVGAVGAADPSNRRALQVAPPPLLLARDAYDAQDVLEEQAALQDISVLRAPARALAASMPSATAAELSLPSAAVMCNCEARRLQQRVVFSDARGRALLYATFLWDSRVHDWLSNDAHNCDAEDGGSRSLVLPSALGHECYEHSRAMLSVVYGAPQYMRPTWGREYVYKRRRKPFLVVQEVFAEGICRYLGPLTPPLF